MATLEGVQSELRLRVEGVLRAAVDRLWVESGYRDPVKQAELFALWQKGLRLYGTRDKARAAGFTPANPPNVSKHCHQPADAVDVACQPKNNALRAQLAQEYGLCTPIADEPWHMELRADRGPIPLTPAPSTSPPPAIIPEGEEDMSRYIITPCPTGGYWELKREDGGIANRGGAPFFDALPGKARVVAPLGGLTPCVQGGLVIGYWVWDIAGHVYAFGGAPHYDGYAEHPEWQSPNRKIIGLVQSGGWQPNEKIRYKQIGEEAGDLDFAVDAYDLPV